MMVNATVANTVCSDPANVRSIFIGADSIEVDYIEPEEPSEVSIPALMGGLRWAMTFLGLTDIEPTAFYFSPTLIKVRTVDTEYTFEGTD